MKLSTRPSVWAVLIALVLSMSIMAQPPVEKRVGLVECGSRVTDPPLPGTLFSETNRIYFGTVSGTVLALERHELGTHWTAEVGGDIVSSVQANATNIFVVNEPKPNAISGRANSTIRSIRMEIGVVDWSSALPFSGPVHLSLSGSSIIAVNNDGHIAVIDEGSGKISRQLKIDGPIGVVTVMPSGGLLAAAKGPGLYRIQPDADPAGPFITTEFLTTVIAPMAGGGFVLGDERGNVTLYGSNDTKAVWRFRSGGEISGIIETPAGILITSFDNFVYLLSDLNGNVIWKRRLNGRLTDPGRIVNGHFVIPVPNEFSVFVLDLRTGKIVDSVVVEDDAILSRSSAILGENLFAVLSRKGIRVYGIGECRPEMEKAANGRLQK